MEPRSYPAFQSLIVLLFLATVVFSASSASLSLLSLDDCFFARKGVEMERSGRFFTATWNYRATFQSPPLQSWITGQSFRFFGENDFAARLPSILMALGVLVLTYLIGCSTASPSTGVTAVALLLITPHFLSNARRCMMEIPTTLWICLAIWIFLKGIQRPKLQTLMALPLGAVLLTKSLLGLLPIFVLLTAAGFHAEICNTLKRPWIWIGIAGGLAIGAMWPIHQFTIFGIEAPRAHYLGEIFSRSARQIPLTKIIFGYPVILMTVFQPVILPALPGFIKMFQERRTLSVATVILLIWIALPVILYSFSGARSSRYIFPILPALALCGGYWLESQFPRFSVVLVRFVTPIILVATALALMLFPESIVKDENKLLKAQNLLVRNAVPELEPMPYVGNHYWSIANPLMYYAERQLQPAAESIEKAVTFARGGSKYLIADADRVSEVQRAASCEIIFSEQNWKLLRLRQ